MSPYGNTKKICNGTLDKKYRGRNNTQGSLRFMECRENLRKKINNQKQMNRNEDSEIMTVQIRIESSPKENRKAK